MDVPQIPSPGYPIFSPKPALVVSALLGAFVIFADYHAVSPGGSIEILTLRDLATMPVCAAVPGVLIAAIYCLAKRTRKIGLKWLWMCLIFFVVLFVSVQIGVRVRMNASAQLAERSAPLVAAIKGYEQKYGRPPDSLDGLVPEFLPAIPRTGMGAYPEYMYFVASESRPEDGNPWVIIVSTPTGILNFDRFFYYPLQNYPSRSWDGNRVERVRDWAYLHE